MTGERTPDAGALPDYEPAKVVTPAEQLARENVIAPVAPPEHRSVADVTKELVEQRDDTA